MYQQIIVQGLVVTEPVVCYGQDGAAVACEFDVVVTKEWKNHNKETLRSEQWFFVRAARALAEKAMSEVRIGLPVLVAGEIGVTAEQATKGEKPMARLHIFAQSIIAVTGDTSANVAVFNQPYGGQDSKPPQSWGEF